MTPKEKAEELVNKMYQSFEPFEADDSLLIDEPDRSAADELWERNKAIYNRIYKVYAKKCAIIAVDEILKMGWNLPHYDSKEGESYWQEVKKEIEKL